MYYKDLSGAVHYLDAQQIAAGFEAKLPADSVEITEAQVLALASPPRPLADTKAALVAAVDAHISAIYSRFTRFDREYVEREAAARAFKAAAYAGDAGVWVTSFATNAGLTAAQATDLIIQQADALRVALELLGVQRMRKYGISAAADAAAAQALHDDIVVQANLIAVGL